MRRTTGITLGVVVVAVAAGPLLVALLIRQILHQSGEATAVERARAEAVAQAQATTYATDVLSASADGVPNDSALDELAERHNVTVRQINDDPELTLVIDSVAGYSAAPFGSGTVIACYQLTFHQLGRPNAAFDITAVATCPHTTRAPPAEPS